MRSLLQARYPGVRIKGKKHPVTPLKYLLSKVFFTIQLSLLATVLIGDHIFATFGMEVPTFIQNLRENKAGSCMMIWIVGNMAVSSMANTGAFEIAYDGQMVFSKLAEGRMPSEREIYSGIDQIMKNAQ